MRLFFLTGFLLLQFSLAAQYSVQARLLTKVQPECWQTVEIGMLLPEQQQSNRNFASDHSRGQNPYTSHSTWMQFSCNGKKYFRPAFYMEEVQPNLAKNIYEPVESEWPWRVRFSPPEPGLYECTVLMGENPERAQPLSTGIRFEVFQGNRHGILHTTPGEPHLSFTDGTPFFILGQNICWNDEAILNGYSPLHPIFISGFYDEFHFINNLAENGGNYFRIVMGPWGLGIESKEMGVYEQDKSFALDSIIRIAEERGMYVQFCVDIAIDWAPDYPKEKWHPIRRAYQKDGMTAADLLKDSAALVALDNFMRYVHARWAYSANVASIEVLCEHLHWEGFEDHKQNFYDYIQHVSAFMKTELRDSLHMIGTSMSENEIYVYKNPALSFIDVHQYDNNFWSARDRFFIYHRKAKNIDKPFLFGEMGITNGPGNNCDADDWDFCNDISMHNALWSTLFQGGMGTGLYWWQWKNDGYRAANYKPMRWFIDNVADGMHPYKDADIWTGRGLEVYYCRDASRKKVVGWVHNTSYWWANVVDACKDRAGNTMPPPKDDDKPGRAVDRAGKTFVITHLEPGMEYEISFYDTRKPQEPKEPKYVKSSVLGKIRLVFPGNADWAFSIKPRYPAIFRATGT